MLGLLQLIRLFDAIDEDFLRCWNGQCRNDMGGCRFLHEQTAVRIYEQINRYDPMATIVGANSPAGAPSLATTAPTAGLSQHTHAPQPDPHPQPPAPQPQLERSVPVWLSSASLTPSQEADILINQQWLQNRLWHLCLSHKLLVPQSEHTVLCIYHAITIAENTLRISQRMQLTSIEVHGVGLIEKLYSIVESAIAAIRHRETAGDWWERQSNASRCSYGESERPGNGTTSISEHGGGPASSCHIQRHKPLLLGFLDLFKTIRAGEHMFLARYSTLVGQDLGLS